MKKLLLFSMTMIAPAIAMAPVQQKYTPLMATIQFEKDEQGTESQIDSLLQGGIDINAQDKSGRTALWLAAFYGKNNLYNYLLSKGANPDIRSTSGEFAGTSAKELHEMDPEEILMGRNISKAKL
ncbi:MAG: hypothetical protein AMXMBFR12_05470 [Candidatus Babeliales bacterium]